MKHNLEFRASGLTSIKQLREMVAAATTLTGGIIPHMLVTGTFETDNALLFAACDRIRNIKTVYCEIYISDDGGKWVRAAYYSPFDVLIESE